MNLKIVGEFENSSSIKIHKTKKKIGIIKKFMLKQKQEKGNKQSPTLKNAKENGPRKSNGTFP